MRFYPFQKIISPFWRWALFLVLLPILELFLLHTFLGLWITLLSMLAGGLFGMFIVRWEGLYHWLELNQQLDRGDVPTSPVLHGVLILLAALLMILPGLLTSLFGLILLFRIPRSFVVTYLVLQFESYRCCARKANEARSSETIDI